MKTYAGVDVYTNIFLTLALVVYITSSSVQQLATGWTTEFESW
jgi:hypothetical protein